MSTLLMPLLASIIVGASASLPDPAVVTYGLPLSYDVGFNRLIPPPPDAHYVKQRFVPDLADPGLETANVFSWRPDILAGYGVDVETAAAEWRASGKVPLYNVTHGMYAFGEIDTATGFYDLYAEGMENPHCDGISIDEYGLTWISFEGQEQRCAAVIDALRRIRADYPGKIIVSWLAGWWDPDWDSPETAAFLAALRDHTDLLCAELYYKNRETIPDAFPMFREMIDKMEARAPGLRAKTIPALTIVEHPDQEPPHNNIPMSEFAEAQLRYIAADPVLRELPGIGFFAAYRAREKTLAHLDNVIREIYLGRDSARKPALPETVVATYGLPLSYDVGHNKLIPPYPEGFDHEQRKAGFVLPVHDWEMETANVVGFHAKQVTDAGVDMAEFAEHWHDRGKILLESLAVGIRIYTPTATVDDIYSIYAKAIETPHMDGVIIDEFMLDWVVNAPDQAAVAMEALARLRRDYPDRIIASWVSGWWGAQWEHPMEKRFLEALRDHTDLVIAEIYYKPTTTDTTFPEFREYIDAMESLAPGISEKMVLGLYAVDHPEHADNNPNVSRLAYLRAQMADIQADPVLRDLRGIGFFAAYRCTHATLAGLDQLVGEGYLSPGEPHGHHSPAR